MSERKIAMKAIMAGMQLLRYISDKERDNRWMSSDSRTLHNLDSLARHLGYKNAEEVEFLVIEEEESRRDDSFPNWYDLL